MADHLLQTARHHCALEERLAHAEFFFHMDAGKRAQLGIDGASPWRGIMRPSLVAMINVLEEMGEHNPGPLAVPANMA